MLSQTFSLLVLSLSKFDCEHFYYFFFLLYSKKINDYERLKTSKNKSTIFCMSETTFQPYQSVTL